MAKQLLVYIENSRCIVFGSNMQEMQQVDFPFDIARDLEILNKDSMHTLIQTAIDTYQIFPAIVMFILSPLITFDKDLSDIPPEQQEPEAQKFLDQVPFQNVLSYRFATQTKQKIIAANKDFVLTMKTAFEKRTFPVTAVVPLVAVQEIMPELIENLDLTLLLAKIETLKQYNMLTKQIILASSPSAPVPKEKNKPNPQRLYLFIGVFIFLILILVIVVIFNYAPKSPAQPKQIRPTSLEPIPLLENKQATHMTQRVQGASTHKIIPAFYTITVGEK